MKSEDFIEITIPNVSGENKFWLIYNAVRRDLFGFLKKEITRLPWGETTEGFVSLMKEVASELPRVWERIKSEYKDNQNLVYRLAALIMRVYSMLHI